MTNETFEQIKALKSIAKNSDMNYRANLAVINVTEDHLETTDTYRLIKMEKKNKEDKTTGKYLQKSINKYKDEAEKDDTISFPNCDIVRENRDQKNENTACLDLKYLKSIIDIMIKQGNKYVEVSIQDTTKPVFMIADKETEQNNLTVDAVIMPVRM